MSATRVLILGARGLLGSSVVPAFRAAGLEVITHATAGADLTGDLTQRAAADAALRAAAPHVVLNLAAATNVDDCERDPDTAYRLNVRLVENLAAAIAAEGSRAHLIHISTDQIYDGDGPHAEDDVRIKNTYAFSKYAGELAAAVVPATVLRTNFVGPSARDGRTSLTDWLRTAYTGDKPITVFDDVLFSPLAIGTLVEYLQLAVERRERGVFNLGSREGLSKADFAYRFAEALGKPTDRLQRGDSSSVKLLAYRPKDMRMDSARFERVFGVTTPTLMQQIASLGAAYASHSR